MDFVMRVVFPIVVLVLLSLALWGWRDEDNP